MTMCGSNLWTAFSTAAVIFTASCCQIVRTVFTDGYTLLKDSAGFTLLAFLLATKPQSNVINTVRINTARINGKDILI